MSGQFLLTVPYDSAVSDTENLAGARVIRMISLSLPGGSPPNVNTVYSYAHGNNDPSEPSSLWFIDPRGMHYGVAKYDPRPPSPGSFPGHWVIYTNTVQTAANGQLQSTLLTYNTAAAALVNKGHHWVCVVGYTYDDSNMLTGFIINDPTYDGGGANLALSLAMWNQAFTPVDGGSQWISRYIEVGDPQPVKEFLEPAARPIVFPGETLIDPETAAKLAIEGTLSLFGEVPNIQYAIKRGHPGEPQLVARLDDEGSYYYVVPLELEGHRQPEVIGAIMVDARYGDVLGASGSEEPFPLWPIRRADVRNIVTRAPIPVRDSAEVAGRRLLDQILSSRWEMRHALQRERVADEPLGPSLHDTITSALRSFVLPSDYLHLGVKDIVIDPLLVWAPCRSVSAFHPFYVVRTPWRTLYVNANSGLVFMDLDYCFLSRLGA